MNDMTCETCTKPVKRWEAVERGNGHERLYFHRGDCFELHKIVSGNFATA